MPRPKIKRGWIVTDRTGRELGWFSSKKTADLYAKMHDGVVVPEPQEAA